MRDPARIDRILKLLGEAWKSAPDQRLGQLLINLGLIEDGLLAWRLEDDDTEAQLVKFLSTRRWPRTGEVR